MSDTPLRACIAGAAGRMGKTLVQALNDAHPNDFVGMRAKNALKDMLAAQATRVSGTLLLEVAKGDYFSKEYETAIDGFRRAIAAMSTSERAEKGLEAYYLMSNSMAQQGRFLEATLALKNGLEKHGNSADATNKELATSLIDSGDVSDHPYQPQFQAFVDNINEAGPMPRTDFATAFESHRVAYAADLSWQEGRPIKLSELA